MHNVAKITCLRTRISHLLLFVRSKRVCADKNTQLNGKTGYEMGF